MDLRNAYEKREKLSQAQLEHLLQRLWDDVTHYRRCIENYPPDRMERFGKPHLAMLMDRVTQVEALLK